VEASIIECYLMWSRTESLAGSKRKDGRQETPFYCCFCDMTMCNKNRLGEHLNSGECMGMDGPKKPFPVLPSADAQRVPIAAFRKHFIQIPPHRLSAPKRRGAASMLEKGSARRAAPAQWDRDNDATDNDDFKEDTRLPHRQQEPAPPKVYAMKPIASQVLGPGIWPGQPIYVSDDDSEEAPASGRSQGCHADVFGRTDGQTDGRSDDGRGGVRDLDAL
jgi:hypothetical protein